MIILGENILWESHEAHEEVSKPVSKYLQSVGKHPFMFARAITATRIRTMDYLYQ